jgi:hypothetical protein
LVEAIFEQRRAGLATNLTARVIAGVTLDMMYELTSDLHYIDLHLQMQIKMENELTPEKMDEIRQGDQLLTKLYGDAR